MANLKAEVEITDGKGRSWRSRLRTAWNADLWAGPVPVLKAAGTALVAVVGWVL